MARARQARFDLRKGLNSAFSEDLLDYLELRSAANARLGQPGSIAKRASSQRIHSTAIGAGAAVLGLHSWRPAAGREVVAIAGAKLYHKIQVDANFTEVSTLTLSTTARPSFAQHVIAGVPTLFFAEGTLRKWDGTTLASVAGAPAGLIGIAVYKGRMFGIDGTKTLYWSAVADPLTWSSLSGGGQGNVETYDAAGLVGIEVVGSSLLLFKKNSIARFTGVSQDDITIDQQTEGTSPDVGTIAARSVARMEEVVFFLTDRGPYVASEGGVKECGIKVKNVFDDVATTYIPNAVVAQNKARHEMWAFVPPTGATTNTKGYVMNYWQGGAWTGPWDLGFAVASACAHELNDESETVLLGGTDGFVRNGDVASLGAKDDVLSNGTGGTNITMTLEFPVLLFGDPSAVKSLSPTQHIRADLKTSGALQVISTGDHMSGNQSITLASKGTGVKQYQARLGSKGRALTLTLKDATSEIVQINGIMLEASITRRAV